MAELVLGVLGEDRNDCDVLHTLIQRIVAERNVPTEKLKVHKRGQNGCATLRRKAEPWMRELAERGCRSVIIIHDRDRNDETQLRQRLSGLAVPAGVQRHVCIPVEEIEAWFFSCGAAMHLVSPERGGSRSTRRPTSS